jgi:hypothetical protein
MKLAKPSYFDDLMRVTTISTVARYWHYHPETVRYHCERGSLAAVKDGGTWLISLQSVVDLWGVPADMPTCEPSNSVNLWEKPYKTA